MYQQIAFSFNHSAQINDEAQAGMNNSTNLQSLCETRRSIHVNALCIFKSAFTDVVAALGYLEEDGDGKVRRYLLSITNVDFIITLVTIEHVLQSLLPLTTFLQSKQCHTTIVTTECLSGLALTHVHKDNKVEAEHINHRPIFTQMK